MDSLIEDAIAIHVDTEGMDEETVRSIEEAIEWVISRIRYP